VNKALVAGRSSSDYARRIAANFCIARGILEREHIRPPILAGYTESGGFLT
jgi:hypothetical protein